MSACDYCDHDDICAYISSLRGRAWPGAQHEVYCLAEDTDGPPYGKQVATCSGYQFVRLDRLFGRRMAGAL